jgi:UDP-glucose 4-epimerase
MKILITGVAGFIGSNLADRLLGEGYEVIGIDNLSQGVETQIPKGVVFHKADIRSKDIYPFFEGVDFVFHLAAKTSIPDCQQNPQEAIDINIIGTVNVLEAARKARVKGLIYSETSAVYEGSTILPTPETDVHPESIYAVTKISGGLLAECYHRFYGLPVTKLRYFNVYGPRQDYRRSIPPVMSAFIIKLLKGEQPIIYGDGSKKRDFVYVDDVNYFHLLCLKDDRVWGKVFNLGSGKSYSVLEIYEMISKHLGTSLAPIFQQDLPGEAQENLADISEAKKLGWEPKMSIEEGLKEMIEYIREEIRRGNI